MLFERIEINVVLTMLHNKRSRQIKLSFFLLSISSNLNVSKIIIEE